MKVGDQVRLNGVKGRIAEILQGGCKAWVKWCDGLQSAEWCAALEKLNKCKEARNEGIEAQGRPEGSV